MGSYDGKQITTSSPHINTTASLLYGLVLDGDSSTQLKGNCCMDWGSNTQFSVGTLGPLTQIFKNFQISEKPWLGILLAVSPLSTLLPCSASSIGKPNGDGSRFCVSRNRWDPLGRILAYGSTCSHVPVTALHSALLRRVSDTGSDGRIATGTVFNPLCFPRQSASASWWKWKKVFACR